MKLSHFLSVVLLGIVVNIPLFAISSLPSNITFTPTTKKSSVKHGFSGYLRKGTNFAEFNNMSEMGIGYYRYYNRLKVGHTINRGVASSNRDIRFDHNQDEFYKDYSFSNDPAYRTNLTSVGYEARFTYAAYKPSSWIQVGVGTEFGISYVARRHELVESKSKLDSMNLVAKNGRPSIPVEKIEQGIDTYFAPVAEIGVNFYNSVSISTTISYKYHLSSPSIAYSHKLSDQILFGLSAEVPIQ